MFSRFVPSIGSYSQFCLILQPHRVAVPFLPTFALPWRNSFVQIHGVTTLLKAKFGTTPEKTTQEWPKLGGGGQLMVHINPPFQTHRFPVFWFLVYCTTTQLATPLHQRHIQVVRSNKVARKRLTESNGTPAMDLGHTNVGWSDCMCMLEVYWRYGILYLSDRLYVHCMCTSLWKS